MRDADAPARSGLANRRSGMIGSPFCSAVSRSGPRGSGEPVKLHRCLIPGAYEAGLVGEHHELGSVVGVELDHRAADVGLGRGARNDERLGDLVVAETESHKRHHLALPGGELIE